MSLAVNASSPTAVEASTTSVTTASFTPPAHSLLVAIVGMGNSSGTNTPSGSVSDSLTNGWTKVLSNNLAGDAANEIWTFNETSSTPSARTVTLSSSPSTSIGVQLAVLVFTGSAASQTGAATAVAGPAGVSLRNLPITTTTTGSYVVGSYAYNVSGVALSVFDANTTNLLATNDTNDGETFGSFRSTSTTGTPGSVTLGYSGSSASANSFIALLEILPALPTSSDLILNPAADVATNSWTTDAGATTNLYAAIDETSAVDSDYVQSPTGPSTAQYYETALEGHADPVSSSGHIAHYRYQKNSSGDQMDVQVEVRQGASTSIASWTHTNIGTSWTQADQTLTGGQADAITDYTDLRLRFTPTWTDGTTSVLQRLAPTSIITQTNLVGSNSAITDDPTSPDGTWLTASSTTTASVLQTAMADPTSNPRTGANIQTVRAWVRKTSGSGTPTVTISVLDGASTIATGSATNITSTSGQLVTLTWNAASLSTASGANVSVKLTGTVGGTGGNRATMEVGAVDWNCDRGTNGTSTKAQVSWANLELPAAGPPYTLTTADSMTWTDSVAVTQVTQRVTTDAF